MHQPSSISSLHPLAFEDFYQREWTKYIIQLVMVNKSNFKQASELIQADYPYFIWTPYATLASTL